MSDWIKNSDKLKHIGESKAPEIKFPDDFVRTNETYIPDFIKRFEMPISHEDLQDVAPHEFCAVGELDTAVVEMYNGLLTKVLIDTLNMNVTWFEFDEEKLRKIIENDKETYHKGYRDGFSEAANACSIDEAPHIELDAYRSTGLKPDEIDDIRRRCAIVTCKLNGLNAIVTTLRNRAIKAEDKADKLEACLRLALQDLAEVSMCDSCLHEAEDDCDPSGDIKGCSWRWRYDDRLLPLGGIKHFLGDDDNG